MRFVVFGRNEDLFLRCYCSVGGEGRVIDEEWRHVECFGKEHSCFVLLLAVRTLVFEALQVQDQNLWCFVYLDHLFGEFVLLAAGAVPLIALFKLFFFAEVHETVF